MRHKASAGCQADQREKIFLVTKSSARSPHGLNEDLDTSLGRMNTDYVDLFFVHAIHDADVMDDDLKRWAEAQKTEGRIRLFGFSTHSNMEQCLLDASKLGWIDGIMMTYNYRLMHEAQMKKAVDACVKAGIIAVLLESVQGEGGIRIASASYLTGIRDLCDRQGWLMMVDEIQSGMGRCGTWFAHQAASIQPDVMTLAKALGNGVPIGACLARGPAALALQPGSHGTTFGGNPLACRAALAVIETLTAEGRVEAVAGTAERLVAALREALQDLPMVREIRHRGLMIGIELDRPVPTLPALALEEGILINVTAERVIRLLPPLIWEETHTHHLVPRLRRALDRLPSQG